MKLFSPCIFFIATLSSHLTGSSQKFTVQLNPTTLQQDTIYYRVVSAFHRGDTLADESRLAEALKKQPLEAAATTTTHPDSLIARWAGAHLLELVWNGKLNQRDLSAWKIIESAITKDLINDPDTRAILSYLTSCYKKDKSGAEVQDKKAVEQRIASFTKSERNILQAARILGIPTVTEREATKQRSQLVTSGILSKKPVEPTNFVEKSALWWNQECADLADRGRTISFSGSNKNKYSLMRALSWLTCGRFIADQGHPHACRALIGDTNPGISCESDHSVSFALPQSGSLLKAKYIWR